LEAVLKVSRQYFILCHGAASISDYALANAEVMKKKYSLAFAWKDCGKPRKPSVRETGVPAEFRLEFQSHVSLFGAAITDFLKKERESVL
jgi:hypothetical protein